MEPTQIINESGAAFVLEHNIAVLSTYGPTGEVHGAAVYYVASQDGQEIHIISKSQSNKVMNIRTHAQVAITIVDAPAMQTIQINGTADIVADDPALFERVYKDIIKPRPYQGEMLMPPVTALNAGDYVLIRVTPKSARFSDYKAKIKAQN